MESNNLIPKEKEGKNHINPSDKYANIKSDYILQNVFNNLEKIKTFYIVKYNNNIKKRINININNYKDYCEKYSSIEIEIKLFKDKYGEFVNIKEEEEEKYYHIYFNNNKEEMKRNYINKDEEIKIINIKIDYQIISFTYLFNNCKCIESIYFKKFYRNNINSMKDMFSGCTSLKELNLSNFNTNNVIYMSYMFYGCSSLKEINLSNFNTNNVTNMYAMFYGCSSLKELNLNNFNTNNVIDMDYMFARCSSLIELNLNNFNINNVTSMSWMFSRCSSLKELNLNDFNTNNLTNMYGMFYECRNELITKIKTQYKNIKEEAFPN